MNRRDDELSNDLRYGVLRPNLNHARTACLRCSEKIAEVQIMREHHETVLPGVGHDDSIRRSRITEHGPVLRLDSSGSKILNPGRAEIHVDRNLHDGEIETSNSSDRQAA